MEAARRAKAKPKAKAYGKKPGLLHSTILSEILKLGFGIAVGSRITGGKGTHDQMRRGLGQHSGWGHSRGHGHTL